MEKHYLFCWRLEIKSYNQFQIVQMLVNMYWIYHFSIKIFKPYSKRHHLECIYSWICWMSSKSRNEATPRLWSHSEVMVTPNPLCLIATFFIQLNDLSKLVLKSKSCLFCPKQYCSCPKKPTVYSSVPSRKTAAFIAICSSFSSPISTIFSLKRTVSLMQTWDPQHRCCTHLRTFVKPCRLSISLSRRDDVIFMRMVANKIIWCIVLGASCNRKIICSIFRTCKIFGCLLATDKNRDDRSVVEDRSPGLKTHLHSPWRTTMTVFLILVRSEAFWLNVFAPLFLDALSLLMPFIIAMNVIYLGNNINIPEEAKRSWK